MYNDKVNIILAEDDLDDRLFFTAAFKKLKMQHSLTICEDGDELMNSLAAAETLPHIIFLDISMPGKSGMQCLKELRANERFRNLTIAIYSSYADARHQEEAFLAGANVYIRKTNDVATLQKILCEVIYINWQYVMDGLNKENFIMAC